MRLPAVKRIAVLLLGVGAILSCEVSTSTSPPPQGALPLATGFWFLHTADDSAVSATIAERTVGIALERTVVDSASLFIESDGSYEQRYWIRVFVTGVLDRSETVIDLGTWALNVDTYTFTSAVRTREFSVTPTVTGQLRTLERMVFWLDAPETTGIYHRTRP